MVSYDLFTWGKFWDLADLIIVIGLYLQLILDAVIGVFLSCLYCIWFCFLTCRLYSFGLAGLFIVWCGFDSCG